MSITDEHCHADKEQSASDNLLQINKHGHEEGKTPLSVEIKSLEDAGHENIPLAKAVRKKCIDCCSFQVGEVRKCVAVSCPLWPYRMGVNPFTAAKRKGK